MRALLWVGIVGLGLIAAGPARCEEKKPAAPALADYFPPPESKGGWRTLLPDKGEPSAEQKEAIAKKTGVDYDKLKAAWDHNAAAEGKTGLLVIRKGYVVGEWYRDCDATTTFNIYSSSKAYTSLAFGLLLADSSAGKLPGAKNLTLDTKVCNTDFLPEALPLSDPRRADITLRQLLNMASGVADPKEGLPKEAPFETALGKTEKSPFAKLKADPGTEFNYSNGGVAHLVLVFKNAAGRDLFPFLKDARFRPDRHGAASRGSRSAAPAISDRSARASAA